MTMKSSSELLHLQEKLSTVTTTEWLRFNIAKLNLIKKSQQNTASIDGVYF
jgi:hypothetical protein